LHRRFAGAPSPRCASARRKNFAQTAENKSARPKMAPALFVEERAAKVGQIGGD
jgi:hypothetical protein